MLLDIRGGNRMRKIIFLRIDGVLNSKEYEIEDCLIKTSFYGKNGGLQREHVEQAVSILNS